MTAAPAASTNLGFLGFIIVKFPSSHSPKIGYVFASPPKVLKYMDIVQRERRDIETDRGGKERREREREREW